MSREERRAYQRMNKNRDPYALPNNPALKARQEKIRARRAKQVAVPTSGLSRRAMVWIFGGAVAAGVIAFSIAWPNGMPTSAYIGVAAVAAWIGVALGLRLLLRRTPPTH